VSAGVSGDLDFEENNRNMDCLTRKLKSISEKVLINKKI
jgi:hypothetical protein